MTQLTDGTSAVSINSVCKRYGDFHAMRDVSLEIAPGTVHAFVGANGAGKSTLLGIIAGKSELTSGRVEAFGQSVGDGDPRRARDAGIAAVYQELTIVPRLTAVDNVFLGQETHSFGRLNRGSMKRSFKDLGRSLNIDVDDSIPAGMLSAGDQQLVEIMRGIAREARILLLDEPTSSLAGPERETLFRLMRRLRGDGVTQILVSHDLDEVLDIADDISVFRDGRLVGSKPAVAWSKDELVRAMLGSALQSLSKVTSVIDQLSHDETWGVRHLQVTPEHAPFSFVARRGEIVGIAGLMGSGRSSIMRALGGSQVAFAGSISLNGRNLSMPSSPRQALRRGVVLVSEDRRSDGFVPSLSAAENFFLGNAKRVSRFGVLSKATLRKKSKLLAERVKLAEHRLPRRLDELSGGNQQKVVFGRAIGREPRMLLVDEPTRGVDVGAKAELLGILHTLAEDGVAVVMVSSEFDELLEYADRILVVAGHELVADVDNFERTISEHQLLELAFGVQAV